MAAADTYTIKLVPFPTAEVADGHSQVAVNAQVFQDGRLAPDGTQVVFETNLGAFRESLVRTSGGMARGLLVAGGVPGVARIKASVVAGDATGSTCTIEFVKSREELSQARETIEVTSTTSVVFANDSKVIQGEAPNKGVTLRYRDYEIHADLLQLDLQSFTLKARKALVKHGRQTQTYDSLLLNLTDRTGYGLTNFPTRRPDSLALYPGGFAFVESGAEGEPIVAPTRMRYGMVEIGIDGEQALSQPVAEDTFELTDISDSPSTVGAKKAVVYARREIQFQKADIYVANAKVLRFPLFRIDLGTSNGSPLVTDDMVSVNDNQVSLNYPYYLTLKPGLTSLLRFRTGERYGQGLTANRGAFLDYELAWSKGDDQQGGFTYSGVGRSDWVASLRQYLRIDSRSAANIQIDSPGGKSIGGSGSVGRTFGNYNLSFSGSQSQTISGPVFARAASQYYGLTFDRNPIRIEGTPLRASYGLTANQSSSTFYKDVSVDNVQRLEKVTNELAGVGLTARAFTDAIKLDHASTVNASFGATQLYGPNATANHGLALNGSVSLNRRLNSSANAYLTYNYLQDGLNEAFVGRHSLSLLGNYVRGNTGINFSMSKGIGVDRMNFSGEASYRLSGLWRLSYTHLLSTYATNSFTEFYAIVSYRIGWREVGLTWSSRSHRPGIQLMNSAF